MATLILNPCDTYPYHQQPLKEDNFYNNNSTSSSSNSNNTTTAAANQQTTSELNDDEPPKVSKFFSSSINYQSKIQQLISFSFTSSNFIFITFILSISKLCTTAATDASQAGAPQPSTAVPSFLMMPNLSGSALMEKLNSFRANTVGPPPHQPPATTVKGKSTPAAANSLISSSTPPAAATTTASPAVVIQGGGSRSSNNSNTSTTSASNISSSTSTATPSVISLLEKNPTLNAFSLFAGAGIHNNDINHVNKDLKFLNVSGKIGTSLGIGNITSKCSEKQFQCGNGDCIPVRYLCDGDSDCRDHSDEMIPECKFRGKYKRLYSNQLLE